MEKRVILITGTPSVGKTTIAKKLATQLNAQYINLTEMAHKEHLILEQDKARETEVIDDAKMKRSLKKIIAQSEVDNVVDGHYAAAVTPKKLSTHVFVLRRNPIQLREFMLKRGYSAGKQTENLEAEILDVCLVEALQNQEKAKICEIDTTEKSVDDVLIDILAILEGKKLCCYGFVDWLSLLEREGKLGEFLKV
jgi:adenylate kinase